MRLTAEQESLLQVLVETWRGLPKAQRSQFLTPPIDGLRSQVVILLPNPSKFQLQVYDGDLQTLLELNLVRAEYGRRGLAAFDLTNQAFDEYEEIKARHGGVASEVDQGVRRYIDDDQFVRRFPAARAKLADAEALLWSDDSERSLTTVGHLCREAMQLFADALAGEHTPSSVDADLAKTLNRVRGVLERYRTEIGERENGLLLALVNYWQAVNGIVQRQEHGSQTAERHLAWDDARRCVFYTFLCMFELNQTIGRATGDR